MKDSRKRARRAPSCAFRPGLDGRLEERFLLTTRTVKLIDVAHGLLKHTKPRACVQRQSAAVPRRRCPAVQSWTGVQKD